MARRRNSDTGDELEDAIEVAEPALDAGDLDLEDPDFPDIVWTVKRVLTPEQMQTMGTRETESFVTKFRGPLDLASVQQQLGGGRFHFYGKVGRQLVKSPIITIEGEHRQVRIAPAEAPNGKASSLAPNGDASSAISVEEAVRRAVARERRRAQAEFERHQRAEEMRRLEAQIAELKQLVAQAASRPPVEQKPERLKDLAETMMMLRQLAPEGSAQMNPLELLQTARQWMEQGILLGEKREPGVGDGGDGWNAERITSIAQAVAQVLSRFTPPRREPPRGAQPTQQPTTAANADVPLADVVPPAAQATQAASGDPHYRWKSAIETVARNMVRGRGPDDTAASIEDTLNEEELKNLKGEQGPDGVWHPTVPEALDWLEGQGIGPFPQLRSPGGLVYTESVLTELRRPEDSDTE